MPDISFDTFYRYDDLTRHLRAYADEYPGLVRVESLGKSYEGRDIWIAIVTNVATGPDREKPAYWVDGNIHATEVSPSTACLYFINTLVSSYGDDPDVTRVLDTRAYYIVPRVNPDGAEWALADKPKFIRSSTRPYPYDEEPIGGLVVEDMDGDGRMLTMRIPDPNGAWKTCAEDPRLMVRRDPTETGGQYYRLLPEGKVDNYDGVTITLQPRKERLDLNRNFPEHWRQEYEQHGAGPYPTSEPEARALVHFIADHPNITGGVAFHTYSGVMLRPYDDRDDSEFPIEDLWTYQKIGKPRGRRSPGTPTCRCTTTSVITQRRSSPAVSIPGSTSRWGPSVGRSRSGARSVRQGSRSTSSSTGTASTRWRMISRCLRGATRCSTARDTWTGILTTIRSSGKIELGGWDHMYAFRNPPKPFVEKEIALFPKWLIWALLISPKLELFEASAKPLGGDAYRVRLVVHNTGWLPSYVTKKAIEKKVIRGLVCEIELPEGAVLEAGKPREELGQLEGRAYKEAFMSDEDETVDRIKVEWVVRAPEGGTVKLVARHERAGTVRAEVQL